MSRSRIEIRVGIFVLIGLAILCTMIIMFGFQNVKLFKEAYDLTAVFNYTSGVVVGAPVHLAGVDIGKVTAIELSGDETNDVNLQLQIRKGVVIRKDSRLLINSLGILGEKYLDFIPRTKTAEPLKEGDKIRGEEPVPLIDIMTETLSLVSDFRKVFEDIFDPATKENVKKIIHNLENLTNEETQKSFKETLKNISSLTGDETRKRFDSILTQLDETTSSMQALIHDHREDLKTIIDRWKTISESVESITLNLNESKGTLGLLVNNPALHESLSKTLTNLNEWITNVRRYGLLHKDKDVGRQGDKEDNRGYLFRKR